MNMCIYLNIAVHYRLAIESLDISKKSCQTTEKSKSTFSGSFLSVFPCCKLQGNYVL